MQHKVFCIELMKHKTDKQITKGIYKRFAEKVFIAKTENKDLVFGDKIILVSKYNKETTCVIYKKIDVPERLKKLWDTNNYSYYSFLREDGFNIQKKYEKKSNLREDWATKKEKSSVTSNLSKEDMDFLSLAEPVKVGHHSEASHRRLIKKYDNDMRRRCDDAEIAKHHKRKKAYYDEMKNGVDLSMPESIEWFSNKIKDFERELESQKKEYELQGKRLDATNLRLKIKDRKRKLELAKILWGDAK